MSEIRTLVLEAIAKSGSEAKLGAACGVSQNAIWSAKIKGRVSPRLAVKIEAATGIGKERLCPDVFDSQRISAEARP